MSPSGSSSVMKLTQPTSPFAPKITSISDGSIVHSKIIVVSGEINEPQLRPMDGNIAVQHDKDGQAFPSTNWPVSDSYFKALVYLSPGWNKLRFDFTSPKLSSSSNGPPSVHSSYIMVNYLPLNSAPPLQLVVLLGKDSPGTFDATPSRIQNEGNDLSMAIRKFRMAAHLWQAFTAEQMYRHKFGRRAFRFDEEWQTGTLSIQDWETGVQKNETRVHVVRCDRTVAELRDLNLAQQNNQASKKGDLFSIAGDTISKHFNIKPGQKQYVACLILDSHWDKQAGTITAHAALGGGGDDLKLAIFGSHALQSYPSCIEEVVPAFTDCTKTDTSHVANDCNESGSSWEAANIGIGAHLHEVGHLLGSPHQETGVMLRDYVRLNRTFCIREPYSTRTKSPGMRVCKQEDECGWHRLDILRFRYHPCFRTPGDEPFNTTDNSIQYYGIDGGRLIVLASTGVAFIEIRIDGADLCHHWTEYLNADPRNAVLPRQVIITEAEIRSKLPEDKKKSKVSLQIWSGSSTSTEINDLAEVLSQKNIIVLPPVKLAPSDGMMMNMVGKSFGDKRYGFKSKKLGHSSMNGSKPQEIILQSCIYQNKLLLSVKVWAGMALDGIEFCYEDGSSQLFGKSGGSVSEFQLDEAKPY
ncbi:hypothetical protein LTR05_007199 [Lithohypha guttulata]|uniref:Uncharacterized protein n=1 Tax=Lithohypha guttulata TaxID=1690604 RepID=A0AAN7SUN5_9EURO|nr:hypothetical protein LTR05_007199 [Lithohypha guttulata]